MLSPELLRRDPERTRATLARRDDDAARAFDEAVQADTVWRQRTSEVETLRAERKQAAAARRGKPSPEEIEEERAARARLGELEKLLNEADEQRNKALAWVPNLPDASVPHGKDDTENEILRTWGEPKKLEFQPLPHW